MKTPLIVVIGASAGGVETLTALFQQFPTNGNAVYFITQHVSPEKESQLAKILTRVSGLPAHSGNGKTRFIPGNIYVAPANFHLLIERNTVRAVHGPRENRQRPAINPMFRSAAIAHKKNVVGVVLSGLLDDGAAGLLEIKNRGGLTIAQKPSDALYPDMPRAAIVSAHTHLCPPLKEIRRVLVELSQSRAPQKLIAQLKRKNCQLEKIIPAAPRKTNLTEWEKKREVLGAPSGFVCPDCNGPLWEIKPGGQYTCLVGHTFSPLNLLSAHSDQLERALWIAMRTLEERAGMQNRLARRVSAEKNESMQKIFSDRARESERHAKLIRKLIDRHVD